MQKTDPGQYSYTLDDIGKAHKRMDALAELLQRSSDKRDALLKKLQLAIVKTQGGRYVAIEAKKLEED